MLRPSLRRITGYIASVAGVLALTLLYKRGIQEVNVTTVALSYLMVVLLVASSRGLGPAVLASCAAMVTFNYFFLPPIGSFTIADPQNWVALGAFLFTAIVASHLHSSARSRARDAEKRREEVWKLYQLSRDIVIIPEAESGLSAIARLVLDIFAAQFCAIFVRGDEHQWKRLSIAAAGRENLDIALPENQLDGVFEGGEINTADAEILGLAGKLTYAPLRVGIKCLGVLVMVSAPLETGTTEAIAGLLAVALERTRLLKEAGRTEALRQSSELKSALLASVSHTLRTPLTSIRAAVDNLLERELEPDRVTLDELHLIISEEVSRLTRLVDNLLEMARIEGGEMHITRQWVLVSEILANVLDRCEAVLAGHDVTARVIDETFLVKVDSRLIAEALVNIVENAAKYSRAGAPVVIEARLAGHQLLITIADRGQGISPEDIDRVFDKFYRGRMQSDAETAGTGMGLAITRGIIEAHGGKVWAESGPGGSIFSIRIPVESKPAAPAEQPAMVE